MRKTVEDVPREEIKQFAAADPAVEARLLEFEVNTLYVAMN